MDPIAFRTMHISIESDNDLNNGARSSVLKGGDLPAKK